jgi:hypothetical protein
MIMLLVRVLLGVRMILRFSVLLLSPVLLLQVPLVELLYQGLMLSLWDPQRRKRKARSSPPISFLGLTLAH